MIICKAANNKEPFDDLRFQQDWNDRLPQGVTITSVLSTSTRVVGRNKSKPQASLDMGPVTIADASIAAGGRMVNLGIAGGKDGDIVAIEVRIDTSELPPHNKREGTSYLEIGN